MKHAFRHLMPDRPSHPRTAGFTLIELLVTISIIAILIGILSPVAIRMLASADVGRTRATLNALAGALDEYKLATGSVPDHTLTTGPSAIANLKVSGEDDNDDTTIGLYLSRVMQLGGTAESMLLAGVGRQGLTWDRNADGTFAPDEKNPPPFNTVLSNSPGDAAAYLDVRRWRLTDPWDRTLRYAARVSHGDAFTDDDYLPAHPTAFFASAGPDEEFGDAKLLADLEAGNTLSAADTELARQAEDNIYSFEID